MAYIVMAHVVMALECVADHERVAEVDAASMP